ncbi:hypothetical protein KSP24_25045 [Paenibacillus sp. AK121]|uniref:head-tail joining protein n=1 Tax=Bacteria TaxID=2 RepID=UPI001C21081E|nr:MULTISPECIES: hypothetical protein [Bacteria]MBU9710143.1 hypothetical protein [Paenibacillus sp. AK121]MCW1920821.1 hypothetical protein [Rhodobacter sp. KR11]
MAGFAAAVAASFRDRTLAVDALYRPGGAGGGNACRVVLAAPDRTQNFGESRFVSDTVMVSIQAADAPTFAAGDTVEVDGVVYRIQGTPTRDATRLVWEAEARAP